MTIERARKEALFAGIALIVVGSLGILSVVLIYARYGNFLNSYSQQEPNAEANKFLIKALKAAAFGLVPSLCVIMIASGASILSYCKKVREQVSHKDV